MGVGGESGMMADEIEKSSRHQDGEAMNALLRNLY